MPGVSPATREALVIDSSSSKPATAPGWDGPSTLVVFATYFGYAMLYVMGHLRDLLGRLVGSRYQSVTGIKVSRACKVFDAIPRQSGLHLCTRWP